MKLILIILVLLIIGNVKSYPNVIVDKIIYTNSSNSVYLVLSPGTSNEYNLILTDDYNSNGNEEIVMFGEFNDEIEGTGWGRLNISFNNYDGPQIVHTNDNDQAYFAGFIEGTITAERIYQMFTNFAANEFHASLPSDKLINYITSQIEFIRQSIFENNENSQYWYSTSLIMSQFDGLVQGYQSSLIGNQYPISEIQLYLLTSAGDLETLLDVFPATTSNTKLNNNIRPPVFKDQLMDCSGLIRVLPNYSDVLFSHVTWRYYYGMLRIYKFYNLQFINYTMDYKVSFSSSPGFLSSKDDFYITGNQLTVMETTNNLFNTSLYEFIQPNSVLTWQRAMIASMIAKDSKGWVDTFSQYNSGTYQNQWMIFDYKLFTVGSPLIENTFWILEQVPGNIVSQDMTDHLNQYQYWASYNIPYFTEVYDILGYSSVPDSGPVYSYSYNKCPRALQFGKLATSIKSIADMKYVMQYNNYKTDPLSYGSPLNAIASRGDLLSIQYGNRTAVAFGAVDCKVTSSSQVSTLSCSAISGPSTSSNTLPPFNWLASPIYSNTTRIGLPNIFNFQFEEMGPKQQ